MNGLKTMSQHAGADARKAFLRKCFRWQMALAMTPILWWNVDPVQAYSAMFGALISMLPQAWFSRQAFRYYGARATQAVTQSFYRGETAKFIGTAVLFAVAFTTVDPLSMGALFAGFIAMTAVNIVCAARLNRLTNQQ